MLVVGEGHCSPAISTQGRPVGSSLRKPRLSGSSLEEENYVALAA